MRSKMCYTRIESGVTDGVGFDFDISLNFTFSHQNFDTDFDFDQNFTHVLRVRDSQGHFCQ